MAMLTEATSNTQTVLVVGDNRLAENLLRGLSRGTWDVNQATHSQSRLETTATVTVHRLDYSPEHLSALLQQLQPDILFSTQSAGSFEYQKQIIDSAVQAQVPRFVLAEFGQDCLNEKLQERLPPYRERAKVIKYLETQEDHITWTGVATGCLLDHALSSGNIGFDLKWQSATIHGTGQECFAASSKEWIGRVARAVLEHWDEIQNQYLYAAGMIVSANAILACLQKTTGQKWETGNMDVEEVVREAERRFERGFPDAGMFLMERTVLFDDALGAVLPFIAGDGNTKLGIEREAVDGVVAQVIHKLAHESGKEGCGCD